MKATLANLYRQATRNAAGSAMPDADTLLGLARGERPADAERIVTEVAQSALQSDLLHFTRALEPASSALSAELTTLFGEDRAQVAHPRTQATPNRAAAGRWRYLRRAALGLAAALVAAVAIMSTWTQHRAGSVAQTPLAGTSAPPQDRIFAALDGRNSAATQRRDVIFHADFRNDEIFHGAFSGRPKDL
jgi:hypothetical protein